MNKNINFGELKGTVLSKSELKEVKYIKLLNKFICYLQLNS